MVLELPIATIFYKDQFWITTIPTCVESFNNLVLKESTLKIRGLKDQVGTETIEKVIIKNVKEGGRSNGINLIMKMR